MSALSSARSGLLPLSRSASDRDAARRREPGLLARLAADPATRLVLVDSRGRVALAAAETGPDLPDDGLTPPDRPGPPPGVRSADGWEDLVAASVPRLAPLSATDLDLTGLALLYLGHDLPDGSGPTTEGATEGRGTPEEQRVAGPHPAAWLAVVVPADLDEGRDAEGISRAHADLAALLERYRLTALRAVGALLSAHDAGLATAATALAAWHARAPRCPACGSRTEITEAGWSRRCPACGAVHFPRTDPAVIMAVTDEADRIVLVHGATWPAGRYSTVAGFVEAGESAEAAVAREVAEEVGLTVASVEYVASQPWPFPRSLMLGFRARLAPGQLLARPDGEEVTDAVVLSRDELVEAVAAGRVVLPGSTSIARLLIEDWFGGPVPAW